MACSLTRDATGRFDFLASTGATVTVKVTAGGNARFVSANQNGNKIPVTNGDTVQFTVAAGSNLMGFIVAVANPQDTVEIIEDCGAGQTQLLERFKNDPADPATGFTVSGS
jgi:hypothetical protein